MSISNNVSFSHFCQLCLKINNASSDKKVDQLQHFIVNWRKNGKDLKNNEPSLDDSLYPVLRLLLPQLDKERGNYGVKEQTLAKIYIRILALPKTGKDAMKLINFRSPKFSRDECGDFADVAFCILKSRCKEGGLLSIEEVNNYLDLIAAYHASGEPRKVDREMTMLLTRTSAEEQKWLIRILLKNMKLGINQNRILNCFHPDAIDLYNTNNDLRKVCELLKSTEIRLNETSIQLFAPFKPMLSEECSIQNIGVYMKRSTYFNVETKLDGERFQLHMKDGIYKYFSRNGYDFTDNFGGTIHEGTLTPRIAKNFDVNAKSCILDGEMMCWNLETKTFLSKSANVDVKSLKPPSLNQSCFCAFDVLMYNDEILTNKPLTFRLEILKKIINPSEGNIIFLNSIRVSSEEKVIELLNEAVDSRQEGLVIKEFLSPYKPNIRKNGGWYKIKPEYTDGLTDTLDLLILGGYYGTGRHKGIISHFLLGVAVEVSEEKTLFYSTAKVGSGYSRNELADLLTKLQPYWKPSKAGESPPCIDWAKEKPDAWVEPKNSSIVEVKATEIIASKTFKTGYTLRFPRVKSIRYDKCWSDCLTLEELVQKSRESFGKLTFSHFTPNSYNSQVKMKTETLIQNKWMDTSKVDRISNLLAGKEICVLSGFKDIDKNEFEKKIIQFGGQLVKNPGKHTDYVLAEEESTVRIKNIITSGSYDIIYASFFFSLLNSKNYRLPEFEPQNFLFMTDKRKEQFSCSYDQFGDHFTIPSAKDSLKCSLMMAKKEAQKLTFTIDDMFNMDIELFCGLSPYGLFRNCVAYFDKHKMISNSAEGHSKDLYIFEIDFRFRGGKCSEVITPEVTHVIVFSGDFSRLNEIKCVNRKRKYKFHVVTERWIEKCISTNSLTMEYEDRIDT